MKEVENKTQEEEKGDRVGNWRRLLSLSTLYDTTRMDVLRVLLVVKYQSSEQVSLGRPLKEGSLMAEADFNSANGEFDIWTNPSA